MNFFLHRSAWLLLLGSACAIPPSLAQDAPAPTPAQEAIRYRQSALYLMAWNLGPIAQMVQGKAEWNAGIVQRNAAMMAQLAPRLAEGFPPGSESGAKTRAKPGIWENQPDFRAKMKDLEQATARFAGIAQTGDQKQVAAELNELVDACKACHKEYRSD